MNALQSWRSVASLFHFGRGSTRAKITGPASLLQRADTQFANCDDALSTQYRDQMELQIDRYNVYVEFDNLDQDDIISSILDLYAEDCTQPCQTSGKIIWAEAEDPEIERIVNETLETIGADSKCFAIARELAKYGNSFSGLMQTIKSDGTPGRVIDIAPAPVLAMTRMEDREGRLSGFVLAPIEQMSSPLGMAQSLGAEGWNELNSQNRAPTEPPWSFVHWRLLGRNRADRYGTSMLFGCRRPYRRLRMAEDSALQYRLKRAPDRFAFGIIGLSGLSPEDRFKMITKVRQELRKRHLIDKEGGQVRGEMKPIGIDEDFIYDVETMKIDRLPGSAQPNQVSDLDWLRKRFMGTLKIPPDYIGFTDPSKGAIFSTSSLSQQDINFARMEKRLQTSVMQGFALVCQIDMAWAGIDPRAPRAKFTLHMNPVSALDEKQRLELEKIRSDTVSTLRSLGNDLGLDTPEWDAYILKRAQLPTHLYRVSGRERSSILKGTVAVISEALQRLDESKIHKLVESKLPTAARTELRETIARMHSIFHANAGPNAYTANTVDLHEEGIPEDIHKGVKGSSLQEWASPDKKGDRDKTISIMTETIKRIAQTRVVKETPDETANN